MSDKNNGSENPKSAKVLKLGLNISVSGEPGTDFEIFLDDKEQKTTQLLSKNEDQLEALDALEISNFTTDVPKHELEKKKSVQEVTHAELGGTISKCRKTLKETSSSKLLNMSESEKDENFTSQEANIINQIKSTMEHFEKFSDHIKEIPRFRNCPAATSTPFSDKYNSKSESSLVNPEFRQRKYPHLYDFNYKKDYSRSSVKSFASDLFLKPLPGEGYYKKGIYTRYFDFEPYRYYGSENSLNKTSECKSVCLKSNYDVEKYDGCNVSSEPLPGILKKSDSENGDKQSTSSADSIKDIKIYQSGGILIMQNFKDNMDVTGKKEISEFSAKLIENCNKLKMDVQSFQEDRPAVGNSSDENKNLGKMVQFDLSSFKGQKSKEDNSSYNAFKDESSGRMESSESTSDCTKNKDSSPQGTSQSQDFPSLSTQENDSILSNQPGTSPTHASSRKLEWDSGADVGYLNLDLKKENLSTIEKIVLKGLSSDGQSEKNIVYEMKPEQDQSGKSKFVFERKSIDLAVEKNTKPKNGKDSDTSDSKKEEKQYASRGNGKNPKIFEGQKNKNSEEATFREPTKDKLVPKFEEAKASPNTNSAKRILATKVNEIESHKFLESSDKGVNVNTLFDKEDWEILLGQSIRKEFSKPSESSTKQKFKKSSKISVSKNKKPSPQRLLKTFKKANVGFVNAKPFSGPFEMGVPKKVYKELEASPALNDVELSREVEEIIIDQRFKIKQNNAVERETTKETEISVKDKVDQFKELKGKNRPISASSSSNNTILPKSENREHVEEKAKKNLEQSKFTDRIIQTHSYDCESVGVQAFSSQVSSDCNFITSSESEIPKPIKKGNRDNVNTSSKNIQAFGLNASLPKQLENPRETELVDNQHTKSTQFFGGPLNSLPNYHSNLIIKPKESCGRVSNILKNKNSEAEIIRLKEENEKNILANDAQPKLAEQKRDLKKRSNNENKENLLDQKSVNSKRSQNERPQKNSNENVSQDSDKKESERKKKLFLVEGSDCPRTSDEISSTVLTSEVLKVHGDSIDRNIIKEKYFQSQLVELEKRKMISRSTSMEMQLQLKGEETRKEYITTGCQYSPQSGRTSEGHYEEPDVDSSKENTDAKNQGRIELEQYCSDRNIAGDHFETSKGINQEQELGAVDSLPSSTQTAHSWVAEGQNSYENITGVGRARSFEYLPGHVYESSGNLREELPSEAEQNLTTSNSDSDIAKGSISNGRTKDSEGRNTLILENSTDLSHDSDRLKILDENLAQLNFAVLKLWEKDAQVQSITQSLLAKLWKKNGSGDFLALGDVDTSKTEVIEIKDLSGRDGKKRKDIFPEVSVHDPEKDAKEREFSIACQTEEKSPSEPEKFYEERKALEKRINQEKKSQIKWIENEIRHLNILRELLEKRNSPVQKKKKLSPLTINSDDSSKSEGNYSKYTSKEICPGTTMPVYGCTVSLAETASPKKDQPLPKKSSCTPKEKEPFSAHYGMAVSLSGCPENWKPLVMLPVDLQVSLKNSNLLKECTKDLEKENHTQSQHSSKSSKSNSLVVRQKPTHSDMNTQYPSARSAFKNIPSTSVQGDFPSPERSSHCRKENCFCINLSENSSLSVSRSSRSKTSEKRECLKLRFSNEDSVTDDGCKTSSSTGPELVEVQNHSVSQTETKNKNFADLSGNCAKPKLVQSTNRKCQRSNDKADSSGNCTKQISIQSTVCKCQNCSKRLPSPSSKPRIISRGSTKFGQPNIYVNCEELSEDVRSCRCSKIQVQKSLNCACHVIKIHGSKCCSPERASCFCTRQNFTKKTENQSCQTDCNSLEKSLEVKNLDESKITMEKRASVLEKLSCDPKVAYKKIHPTSAKLELEEKNSLGSKIPEMEVPVKGKLNCSCRKKAEKEKTKVNDQPRHYFLRVVETEVDDSNELIEQKKSLEVITVTVPVKKAGKGKIYSSNVRQTRGGNQAPLKPFFDVASSGCNCCADCQENCRVPIQSYESRLDYQRSPAEKPESPTGNSGISKICSSENINFYRGVNYPSKDLPRDFSSSQENYQDRNGNKFGQTDSSYSQKPIHDSYESQYCGGCNCLHQMPSREIQNGYNSHKKRRGSNARECYNGGSRFYENRHRERMSQDVGPRFDRGPCADDWSSGSRHAHPQNANVESDRCNSDYYNYNKREFMTKSEILKEEQKRKVHQLSLQECLSSNRPDFFNSAEKRRQIISERAKERVERHNNRMECLLKMMQRCNENENSNAGSKRIFTTVQMREQTMKKYKKLPEVMGKVADQKKKEEYRTNRLMADIFAKKLQIEALKGHINLSNSVSVLYTL